MVTKMRGQLAPTPQPLLLRGWEETLRVRTVSPPQGRCGEEGRGEAKRGARCDAAAAPGPARRPPAGWRARVLALPLGAPGGAAQRGQEAPARTPRCRGC